MPVMVTDSDMSVRDAEFPWLVEANDDPIINADDISGLSTDHGALTGLGDDDHTQYLLANGTRDLNGSLTITGDLAVQDDLTVTDVLTVNGVSDFNNKGTLDFAADLNTSTEQIGLALTTEVDVNDESYLPNELDIVGLDVIAQIVNGADDDECATNCVAARFYSYLDLNEVSGYPAQAHDCYGIIADAEVKASVIWNGAWRGVSGYFCKPSATGSPAGTSLLSIYAEGTVEVDINEYIGWSASLATTPAIGFVATSTSNMNVRVSSATQLSFIATGMQMAEAKNIVLGTTTGTKIGTATTQKLGFFNATPIVQPAANADTSGATLAQLETEVNEVKQTLRDLGLMA